MNFSGIKSKILSKKTSLLLKDNKYSNTLSAGKLINSVGIIVNEESSFNFEELKKLQKNIPIGSNNFHILTYKNNKESYNEFRGAFFYEKYISLTGSIKSKEIVEFLDNDFDMLIDFTGAKTIFSQFLTARSKSKFKVGYAIGSSDLYDLLIAVPFDDIKKFNVELLKYLKILKKI